MIRRSTALIAGAMLLGAMLTCAGPAAAQGKKPVIALPGIPPIFSVTIAYVAEKQGFFKKHGADVEIRHLTTAPPQRAQSSPAASISPGRRHPRSSIRSPTPTSHCCSLRNAQSGLGHRRQRDRQDLQGHGRPGRRRRLDQWRPLRCPSLHAHRRLSWHEDRGCGTGCARLGHGPALIAGRLHYAVLQLDDLAEIEARARSSISCWP